MIKIESLKKLYRNDEVETMAVNIRSLEIPDSEFLAIMGPSGCGKSTLLNILGLLDVPTRGSYLLKGQEMYGLTEKERADVRKQSIGFIFQNFNLIEELTVYENIELPLLYLDLSSEEITARIHAVMERMQISHRRNHFPQQLSGGQQQRVAVARAVVTKPKMILADEPTGNLDSNTGKEVMNLLREINESGATIIMVTHSGHDAGYANRIINLWDGEVLMKKNRD